MVYCSTLKTEAVDTSETLVTFFIVTAVKTPDPTHIEDVGEQVVDEIIRI
jgi:hypothetical protein